MRIICLMGPTASGKTQLALELAQKRPIEIISVDSALIYRGMNIGTAKPDASLLKAIPHHLIDICDPSDSYSVAKFKHDAETAIADIIARDKLPLLVGGTMLYFNILQKGIAPLPAASPTLRQALTEQAAEQGWPFMHGRLAEVDAMAAQRIHPHDSQRVQRALEVFLQSGKTLTAWLEEQSVTGTPYEMTSWIIAPTSRDILHQRIATRFAAMFKQGFIEEVAQLYARGDLSLENPSMRAVGYRQVWQYLAGQLSLSEAQEKAVIATRQLAKRQFTWLRRFEEAVWYDALDPEVLNKMLQQM